MCMKNLNVNIVFSDIEVNTENNIIGLSNINDEVVCNNASNNRVIPKISTVIFITGTQDKNKPSAEPGVLNFEKKYEFSVRLTETISGQWKDIDRFTVSPENIAITKEICKDVFNTTHFTVVEDVSLPSKAEHERFAIKVLVREYDTSREKDDGWIIQTVLPIPLKFI